MAAKIFLSYNPNVEIEQSTALRLQTLAALYGVEIYLPDRRRSGAALSESTQLRIKDAHIFLMFSMSPLSSIVQAEVMLALGLAKPVVVFYDKRVGKNLMNVPAGVIEEAFDPVDENAGVILQRILSDQRLQATWEKKESGNGVAALVAVGLGLFALWAMTKDDDDRDS